MTFRHPAKLLRDRFLLLQLKGYRLFLIRVLCARISEGIWFVVSSWATLTLSGSAASVALLGTLQVVPAIVAGPFIGVICDRRDRRVLLAAADAIKAAIILGVAGIMAMGSTSVIILYGAALAMSLATQVQLVAYRAMTRDLVAIEQLVEAQSTTSMATQIGMIVGPIIASLEAAFAPPEFVMACSAFALLVGAACARAIETRASDARVIDFKPGLFGYARDLTTILPVMINNRLAAPILFMLICLNQFIPLLNMLLPVQINSLHLNDKAFGFVEAFFAAGNVMAGFVVPAAVTRWGALPVAASCTLLFCLSVAACGFSFGVFGISVSYFFCGAFFHVTAVYTAWLQGNMDHNVQGKIFGIMSSTSGIASILLLQCIGAFIDGVGPKSIYLTLSGILLLCLFVFLFYRNRARPQTYIGPMLPPVQIVDYGGRVPKQDARRGVLRSRHRGTGEC